ncbi:hypothetical protein, partial [Bacillus cereus]
IILGFIPANICSKLDRFYALCYVYFIVLLKVSLAFFLGVVMFYFIFSAYGFLVICYFIYGFILLL